MYSKYYHLRTGLQSNSFLDSFNIIYGVIAIGILHFLYMVLPLSNSYFTEKIVYFFSDGSVYTQYKMTILSFLSLDFLQIGIPEELAKFAALGLCLYLDPAKNRQTSIYRGACIGLGFAMIENYSYITNLGVSFETRLLMPTLLHASLGIIMGFYMFGLQRKNFYKGLLICAFIHGFYDFSCMVGFGCLTSSVCVSLVFFTMLIGEIIFKKSRY